MRKSLFLLAISVACCAHAQNFKVGGDGKIVSEINCYSFDIPAKWNVRIDGTAPYFVNFSPKKLVRLMDKFPRGGADIGVSSALDGQNRVKSIDQWMELENRANSFTSEKDIHLPAETTITKATEITWTEQTTESWQIPTQAIMVFFVFRGQPFRAGVEFNANDTKRDAYEKTLIRLLESFRPLAGIEGSSGCSSKSPF